MAARPAALVFDAYGTLFDVHSVVALCETFWPGHGAQCSQLWRAKQLEYTWLRTLMGRYEDFAAVTQASLRHACDALRLPYDDAKHEQLMHAYLQLAPFPDVRETLEQLRGIKLAILSNGVPTMLDAVVLNSGLNAFFSHVLSVDALKAYKPTPAVYQLAVDRLGVGLAAIAFVSSNCWDAIGARSFGLRTFWVNRAGLPVDRLGVTPDHEVRSLADIPALVAG